MPRFFPIMALTTLWTTSVVLADTTDEFFESRIRPVLFDACLKCHGGEKTSSGLRVDSRELLIKGGDRGPAIVPGDSEQSLLIQSITNAHPDLSMPPNRQLSNEVTRDFVQWIDRGAVWPETVGQAVPVGGRHWAFEPILPVRVPDSADPEITHPIDRFLAVQREELGLRAVVGADRRSLIRRASYDLVGLPPTWERVKRFMQDDRGDAYDELLDELLASPQYGERWGRHWLDLARYADTAGENSDYPIPQAHLYRDYVIDAFNADKPYDDFIREQIAGDIIGRNGNPEAYSQRVIATGFIAQSKRFGTGDLEDMHLIIEDTLDTMGKVVLGLGLRCARCHDHKYDPTTMQDYYALYGIFQSTSYPFPGGESVKEQRYLVSTIHPDELESADAAYFAEHAAEIDRLKQRIESEEDPESSQAALKAIETNAPSLHSTLAYAIQEGKPGDASLQKGGNPHHKGEIVKRRFPTFLSPDSEPNISEQGSGRLQLAEWLTNPDNPLTARVMANRIWQFHFGKPIVPTPSNFGLQGTPPTHPELLDWLAYQFVRSGWSIKAMHRLIMTSQAYQLASLSDPHNETVDSGNDYYWRFDRRRLDAESIRDSMLLISGNLNLERPVGHPFPSKDKWNWTAHRQFKAVYPSQHRTVYLMVQRLHPHPFLSIFNGPDTSASTAVRDTSIVPLQALFMANSEWVETQANGLAKFLLAENQEMQTRIETAFQRVLLRSPNEYERERAAEFLNDYLELLETESAPPESRQLAAWTSFGRILLTANEFLFVD